MPSKNYQLLSIVFLLWVAPATALQTPEPVSWEELQILQQDSLLSLQELGLAPSCPDVVTTEASTVHSREILYTSYHWESHQAAGGKCLVLLAPSADAGMGSIPANNFLIPNQAQVLLSASKGTGFGEKGFFDEVNEINRQNMQALRRMATSDCPFIEESDHHEEVIFQGMPHIKLTEEQVSRLLVQESTYPGDDATDDLDNSAVFTRPSPLKPVQNVFKVRSVIYSQECLDQLTNMSGPNAGQPAATVIRNNKQ